MRLRPGAERRLRQVVFTGDFFCAPARAVADLEAALAGVMAAEVPAAVERFFYDTASCYPERGIGGLRRALAVVSFTARCFAERA